MREEHGVGNNMSKSDKLVILDWLPQNLIAIQGEDLPVVVGIGEWITSNLLTLTGHSAVIVSQGVLIRVTVEES